MTELDQLRQIASEVAQELDNLAQTVREWMQRPRLAEHLGRQAARLREVAAEPTASPPMDEAGAPSRSDTPAPPPP